MADVHFTVIPCAHCGNPFSKPVTSPPSNTRFCSLECRFWSKVDKSGGSDACWPWTAARTSFGYGSFGLGSNRFDRSHRVAYRLTFGEIPKGLCVCHKCDNPACCNPSHYFLGTHQENMIDMHSKKRNQMTREGLERLKASKRGKPRSPETRAKLSEAAKRQHERGAVYRGPSLQRGIPKPKQSEAMKAYWARRKASQAAQ